MSKKDWFASWFDTAYYHTLYQSRDDAEARQFIIRLVQDLSLIEDTKVLDLACGKGRHSRTLNELGMNVLGVDLSNESISFARKNENENLRFSVHDMREIIPNESFDCIFNLFTSFGYFDNDEENEKVLQGVSAMLRPNGLFVFDYLNLENALSKLIPSENRVIDGIEFDIRRHFDGKFIRKGIEVRDNGESFQFEEKVRGFTFNEIEDMMKKENLEPLKVYGDFELNPYDESSSERMIIICKKGK